MKKILIVEDDQLVANIYGNKFSREGFQVKIAPDGQAGLALIRNFQPDAVILDLMLPKITGVELTKMIRAEPGFEHLPVIVFSNAYQTSVMQQAWKAGATKCLSKANCTPEQVIDVVRGALAGRNLPSATPPPFVEAPAPARTSPPLSHSPPAANGASACDADTEFEVSLRTSFVEGLPATLAVLRTLLQGLIRADTETARRTQLDELYRRIHTVTGNAGIVGMPQIARLSEPLEGLLKELYEKPKTITISALRTVASAIDFLGLLFKHRGALDTLATSPPTVLVVDDEAISRPAVTYALEKAKLKSVSIADPAAAYDLLAENPFDLIFLDVDMPGMDGFDLCSKLRKLPAHKKTPVIFVTGLTDFESRTNSAISGGNDLIAKPFVFVELAVKALVCVLRARLQAAK
jgi:DNA-binding response OmpR family regulator